MFENIAKFFKKLVKSEKKETPSKDTAKERLHLVLMQDRANVSADFLELMKQEIIEVIKKYIEVEESAIDVRLTNEISEDGTTGAPSLYANIPIVNIKNSVKKETASNLEELKETKSEYKEKKIEASEKTKIDNSEQEKDSENIEIKENKKEEIQVDTQKKTDEELENTEKKQEDTDIKQEDNKEQKEKVNNKNKTNQEIKKNKDTKSNAKAKEAKKE